MKNRIILRSLVPLCGFALVGIIEAMDLMKSNQSGVTVTSQEKIPEIGGKRCTLDWKSAMRMQQTWELEIDAQMSVAEFRNKKLLFWQPRLRL